METTTFIPGLNRQHESLPLRVCKSCGRQIVWCKSSRTGKSYPVNVARNSNRANYLPTDFHKCGAFGRTEATEVSTLKSTKEIYTEMLASETDPQIIAHLTKQISAM